MTTGQSQKNITYKGCTIDDDGSLDPVWNKVDMLEADDSKRACIPAKLQLADFFQLRQAEIGPECVKTPTQTLAMISQDFNARVSHEALYPR